MKLIVILMALVAFFSESQEFDLDTFLKKTYVTVGAGYKIQESTITYQDDKNNWVEWKDPYSARLEVGYLYSKNVKFGISHHSQWLSGFPFDGDRVEYSKTEIFIDYTFTLR